MTLTEVVVSTMLIRLLPPMKLVLRSRIPKITTTASITTSSRPEFSPR